MTREPDPTATAQRDASRSIRVVALGVLIWHDHLLLAPVSEEPPSWRCLGGSVEFGERAAETVVRELREETGRDVEVRELIEVSENIFQRLWQGDTGHEVVYQYLVRWAPGQEPPGLAPLDCVEHDGGRFRAQWLPLAEVVAGVHTVYPDGFPDRLARWLRRR